ncbi:hypothetical protein HY29_00320 [Hyphomonas beringensis]|uniref:SMP-30/Gluconolactonase/LRE-like region domain-containing protein n=1 Tax=Hyphomonas beringensis TaxID=1280946 RepID=A0A062UFY5_9PROT|nr:SMP-30/gluconolactonase/LRE family protein [Hyphomonas beringensis]KCZ57202.1 hypothetical protein HY29_00320 [Hyphomonas beringensis]
MTYTRRLFLASAAGTGLASACAMPHLPSLQKSLDVEILDKSARDLISPGARLDVLASGYTWSEGPVWDRKRRCLYFSDVPENTCWKWTEDEGATVFLRPSGAPADETNGFREPGANGLAISHDGRLLICNHGRRAVQSMDIDTKQRTTLVSAYDGKPLNSPNDVVEASDGTLFFTDPPYGLEGMNDSPLKAQDANGVYRFSPDGSLTRVISTMTFPNGVALSPDETTLYVTQSDPDAAHLLRMGLGGTEPELLFDAAPYMAEDAPGLPDGLAIDETGHIFTTGPGGVFILSADGIPLARIKTGKATANCCFGDPDGRTLYLTAHDTLMRIRTRTRGLGWS